MYCCLINYSVFLAYFSSFMQETPVCPVLTSWSLTDRMVIRFHLMHGILMPLHCT